MDGEESLEDEDEESITILLGGGRGSFAFFVPWKARFSGVVSF